MVESNTYPKTGERPRQNVCKGLKFYYLVRHVKSKNSPFAPARQLVCHGRTETEVEAHLERVQQNVVMPSGCTYSIEHF